MILSVRLFSTLLIGSIPNDFFIDSVIFKTIIGSVLLNPISADDP